MKRIFDFVLSTCSREMSHPGIQESIYSEDASTKISYTQAIDEISEHFEEIRHLASQKNSKKYWKYHLVVLLPWNQKI